MKNKFVQNIREKYFSVNIEDKISRKVFFWRVILINILYWILVALISLIGLNFIFWDFFTWILFLSFFVSTIWKIIYYSSLIYLFRKRANDIGLQWNFSRNLIFINFIFSILSSVLFIGYMAWVPGMLYPIWYFFWQQLIMVCAVFYGILFNGFDLTSAMPLIFNFVNLIMLVIITSYITGGILFFQYIKMSLIKWKSK